MHYAVKRAVDKIELLTKPDRERTLLMLIEKSAMSGTFSWSRWALDKILTLRLKHLAGPLRKIYEKKMKTAVDGPDTVKRKLLAAIHQLGGELSAEEIELLRQAAWIE